MYIDNKYYIYIYIFKIHMKEKHRKQFGGFKLVCVEHCPMIMFITCAVSCLQILMAGVTVGDMAEGGEVRFMI